MEPQPWTLVVFVGATYETWGLGGILESVWDGLATGGWGASQDVRMEGDQPDL